MTFCTPPLDADLLLEGCAGLRGSSLEQVCRHALAQTGKQLRPRIAAEASRLASPSPDDLLTAMRAVELLHVATLLHDDVVDASSVRRGSPSAGHRYGAFAAEYAGGWLLGSAMQIAGTLGADATRRFSRAVCELCEGEMLEMQQLWDPNRTEASYLAAIEGKTASLFWLSATLGGLVGGVDPLGLDLLGTFGLRFGMAFQIADDLADLLASPEQTGKRRGTDVRHGVYTLPVLYAAESVPDVVGRERVACDRDVDAIVELILDTDAVPRVLALCERYLSEAFDVARELDAPGLLLIADELLSSTQSLGHAARAT